MVIIVALAPLSRKKPVTCHVWVRAGLPGQGELGRIPFQGAQKKNEEEAKPGNIPPAPKRREYKYIVWTKDLKHFSL
jgi:hypothetical protein